MTHVLKIPSKVQKVATESRCTWKLEGAVIQWVIVGNRLRQRERRVSALD